MNRNTLLTVAVIGLLLLNLGTLAFLFSGRHRPVPAGGPPRLDRMITEELHLNEAQQKQFERLKTEHHRRFVELDQREKQTRDQLLDLLKTDSPDTTKADSLMAALGQIRVERERLNFNHFRDLRAMCNAGQKSSFDDLMERLSDFINRSGPPGPPPPRP